ncbi:MAG: 30S ribosome-binding factor RbfA [Gemmataceae bacterium]|jgi:ribosome-binding factor A|nr:30S ribosome-binding factor RbfA [Gemmataceae bacterium]MBJ7345552.1 30S ribosome-binding factor RbfA [Gemmataceae bacterium]MBJ7432442.1 30S ribosome-binding factor RbfA [Gemmataceae bacterium]MBJ7495906.1 30S ribosome-binding factor RbfA [Gemmataceae bacterium]
MKTHRTARIAEVIREVASETILFKMSDPRISMVTVLRAEVSGDLQHGKIYVSVMGDEEHQKETLYALNGAAGFVQSQLADRMKTRFLPVLTFVLDQGVKRSLEISKLIQEALTNPSKLSDSDQIKEEEEADDDVEQEDSDGDPSDLVKEE